MTRTGWRRKRRRKSSKKDNIKRKGETKERGHNEGNAGHRGMRIT